MYTDDEIQSALFQILTSQDRIRYDDSGLAYILDELKKKLPPKKIVFSFEPIEDMSVQDRIERKLPKLHVTYE